MDNPRESGDGKDDREDARHQHAGIEDPLLAAASALRGILAFGAGLAEIALAQRGPTRAPEPLMSLFDALSRISATVGKTDGSGSGASQNRASTPPDDGGAAELAMFLSEAWVTGAVSGIRYWQRIAQTLATHRGSIVRSLSAKTGDPKLSPREERELVDALRQYLREIGDISTQEARNFQAELERIAEALARSTPGSERTVRDWRRWRVIP
jgi:hypothetical protein